MKHRYYIVASILLMFTLTVRSLAASPPMNLVIGVGAVNSSGGWYNYSAINVISGSSLLPITSSTTVLYIGFTGGSFADIDNMVLYTTNRNNNKITAVTPVKFHEMSNPSINLTNKTFCPTQPVSNANPCVVRLDPIALSLSTVSDYYFVVHFASNSNNSSLSGAVPDFINRTSLTGSYQAGDDTRLRVGETVPSVNSGYPFFLMLVMNN